MTDIRFKYNPEAVVGGDAVREAHTIVDGLHWDLTPRALKEIHAAIDRAVAEARREGAKDMRERAASHCAVREHTAACIRSLSLPDDEGGDDD